MAFPTGWPPRPASGVRSIRYYQSGTAAAAGAFADNAYLFIDGVGANPYVPLPYVAPGSTASVATGTLQVPSLPATGQDAHDAAPVTHINPPVTDQAVPRAMLWSSRIRIENTGANDLDFSFDGTNVHGVVPAGEVRDYTQRIEAGIAIKSTSGTTFRIEAW
jgi:hypothetical protein